MTMLFDNIKFYNVLNLLKNNIISNFKFETQIPRSVTLFATEKSASRRLDNTRMTSAWPNHAAQRIGFIPSCIVHKENNQHDDIF